jgi:hypothetical protein
MTTGESSTGSAREQETQPGRTGLLMIGGGVLTAAAVLAFLVRQPILGALLAIVGLTLITLGAMARDWDRHPTYEDRELARAQRRKEKWERGGTARARDRARWEAHQARQGKAADR